MKKLVYVLLLSIWTGIDVQAQTIAEVLKSVEKNNLQLKAQLHQNEAEILELKGDNVLSGPSIEYTPQYQKGLSRTAETELIVSEEFQFPTKYAARNKQAKMQKDVLSNQFNGNRRTVLLDAELVCLGIIKYRQVIGLLKYQLANIDSMQKLYEKSLEQGSVSLLDLNSVKVKRIDVVSQLSLAEKEQNALKNQLILLNGGQNIVLSDSLFPKRTIDLDFDEFVKKTKDMNAEIQAAKASVAASQQAVSLNRQSWLPSLVVGYRRNTVFRENEVNGVVVGMNFPLMSTSKKVKAAKLRQKGEELALENMNSKIELQLKTQYDELCEQHRLLGQLDRNVIFETLDLLQKSLKHGEISTLQFQSESNQLYSSLLNYIEMEFQYAVAMAQLHQNEL